MKKPPTWRWPTGVAASSMCATLLFAPAAQADGDFCPKLYSKGNPLELNFNPAFISVDKYDTASGEPADGLTVSSFFNAQFGPGGMSFFERDLVARIPEIGALDLDNFDPNTDVQELTDLMPFGPPRTVWPNEAERAPDGVFPFEAVVIPQGFLSTPFPGRLTAVDVATGTEYVIHQSTKTADPPTFPPDPANSPRFYHRALFMDMDGDGLKDIVTVRSGFMVGPQVYPPFGELVWFKNPGAALDPNTPWQETVLYGGITVGFLGPDIALDAYDFEGDGVPEIVATHFFSAFPPGPPGSPPPMHGKISIYGAPPGMTWGMVNQFVPLRTADLSTDQGFPFDVQIVDLNRDGRVDILATNHQPDNCTPMTTNPVPGRVYALEQPESGDIFGEPWATHILLDNIRPQPSLQPVNPPGRLAPGHPKVFWPKLKEGKEPKKAPWIVVGGDEAGKVWVLKPEHDDCDPEHDDCDDEDEAWQYEAAVVFDINDYYGPGTTQTPTPTGVTISTVGSVGVRYDEPDKKGKRYAELYVPVFEGKEIHVFSFRKGDKQDRVQCVPDTTLACPPWPPGPPPQP